MKANSKHYILLFVGLITLATAGFGYWFVYNTTISQAQGYSQLLQQLELNKNNQKQEQKLLEIDAVTLDRRSILPTYFITDDKILDFIKSIENIDRVSSSTEIVLSSITSDDAASETKSDSSTSTSSEMVPTEHVKVHVSIKGSWNNVNKVLVLLENLPYSISISSINLNSPAPKIWNLSLDISALTIK